MVGGPKGRQRGRAGGKSRFSLKLRRLQLARRGPREPLDWCGTFFADGHDNLTGLRRDGFGVGFELSIFPLAATSGRLGVYVAGAGRRGISGQS